MTASWRGDPQATPTKAAKPERTDACLGISCSENDSWLFSLEYSFSLSSFSLNLWFCSEYFVVPTTGAMGEVLISTGGTTVPCGRTRRLPVYSEPSNCGTRLSVYSESHYFQHNQEHLVTLEESIFRTFGSLWGCPNPEENRPQNLGSSGKRSLL